jgi:hypothetical protein
MEKLHLDRVLRYWIGLQVSAALSADEDLDRNEIQFEVSWAIRSIRRCGAICTARWSDWLESVAAFLGMAYGR